MTERKWVLREVDEAVCNRLQAELGVFPLTAKLLSNRGLDSADKVKAFLNKDEIPLHDPYLLKDMEPAVARIRRAIENKEPGVQGRRKQGKETSCNVGVTSKQKTWSPV